MAWRKIEREDVKLGTIIRMTRLDDGYGTATICSLQIDDKSYPHILVARPYAYAHKDFNTKQPLVGVEVFPIGYESLFAEHSDVEVCQGRDNVRNMST